MKLPMPGTNPRGVEIRKEALEKTQNHENTYEIKVHWTKQDIQISPYKRWVDYWET